MKHLLCLVCTLLVAAAEAETLDLEQLLKIAFKQNLALQSSVESANQSQLRQSVEYKSLLPELSLSSRVSRTKTDQLKQNAYSTSLDISQPIYRPDEWGSWEISKIRLSRDKLAVALQQQQLLLELKANWYQYLLSLQLVKEAKSSLQRLKQHLHNTEVLYQNGKIWRNDVLQAQVNVARGENKLLANEHRVRTTKTQINLLLNRQILSAIETTETLKWLNQPWELQQALAYASENRVELKQANLDLKIANKNRAIVSSKFYPTLDLTLSAISDSPYSDLSAAEFDKRITLNMKWDLWQWHQTKDKVAVEDINIRKSRIASRQLENAVLAEVEQSWLNVSEAQQNLTVLEQALSQAEENYRVSQIRYGEQLGSANDVLDAQELLTRTREDRVLALSNYLTSLAQLEKAIGLEIPAQLLAQKGN